MMANGSKSDDDDDVCILENGHVQSPVTPTTITIKRETSNSDQELKPSPFPYFYQVTSCQKRCNQKSDRFLFFPLVFGKLQATFEVS